MNTTLIFAILVGMAFGFALDRVGATNPNYIINMLRFKDLHLMKTILLGIATGSILLFAGLLLGVVDAGHLSVKDAYVGVIAGGAILGLGFALAGFCPGTGLTAWATGRKDALFFVLGGLVGAFVYMITYVNLKDTILMQKIAGGKATIGAITGTSYPTLFSQIPGEFIGLGIAVLIAIIAWKLPQK